MLPFLRTNFEAALNMNNVTILIYQPWAIFVPTAPRLAMLFHFVSCLLPFFFPSACSSHEKEKSQTGGFGFCDDALVQLQVLPFL
jgi:hypothetical protein